jgi:hypothetical protein
MRGVATDDVPEIRIPIREILTVCCALAEEQSAKSRAHTRIADFAFRIANFKVTEQNSSGERNKNRLPLTTCFSLLVSLFLSVFPAQIRNPQFEIRNHFITLSTPGTAFWRNRLTILDFRFWILDCSLIGLLCRLWPRRLLE